MYDIIDQATWKRKALFDLFATYDNPTWDLMSELRITSFYRAVKAGNHSFFFSFLYACTRVCNDIEALRCRIDAQGQVRLYDVVHPGSTLLYDDETYGFAYFDYKPGFRDFMPDASQAFIQQKAKKGLDPKDDDLARIYFSAVPWVSFSGFRHPFRKAGNTSIPMIIFGKHFEREGERYMPVGITLHHGLADGFHAGLFFNQLQAVMDHPDCIPEAV